MNPSTFYEIVNNKIVSDSEQAALAPISSFGDCPSDNVEPSFDSDEPSFDLDEPSFDLDDEDANDAVILDTNSQSDITLDDKVNTGLHTVNVLPSCDGMNTELYVKSRLGIDADGSIKQYLESEFDISVKDELEAIQWYFRQYFCVDVASDVINLISISTIKELSPSAVTITNDVLGVISLLPVEINKSQFLLLINAFDDNDILLKAIQSDKFDFSEAYSSLVNDNLKDYIFSIVCAGIDSEHNFSEKVQELLQKCEDSGIQIYQKILLLEESKVITILQHYLNFGRNDTFDEMFMNSKIQWFKNFYAHNNSIVSADSEFKCICNTDFERIGIVHSTLSEDDMNKLIACRYSLLLDDSDYKMYLSLSSEYQVDLSCYKIIPSFNVFCMNEIIQKIKVNFRVPNDVGRAVIILTGCHQRIISCEAPLLGITPFADLVNPQIELLHNNAGIIIYNSGITVPDSLLTFSFKFLGSFRSWASSNVKMSNSDAVRYNQLRFVSAFKENKRYKEFSDIMSCSYPLVYTYESVTSCLIEEFPRMIMAFNDADFASVMRAMAPCINVGTETRFLVLFLKNYFNSKQVVIENPTDNWDIIVNNVQYTIGGKTYCATIDTFLGSINSINNFVRNTDKIKMRLINSSLQIEILK